MGGSGEDDRGVGVVVCGGRGGEGRRLRVGGVVGNQRGGVLARLVRLVE